MPKSAARYVLDSYALIAFFQGERSATIVEGLLDDASMTGQNLLMCSVNWGEVFYTRIIDDGEESAEQTLRLIETMPITVVVPNLETTKIAARFKALGGISYADCFGAALAVKEKAILVTGDNEFKQLEKRGLITVRWLP